VGAAEFEKCPGVRQLANRMLFGVKRRMIPRLQLGHGQTGREPVVKALEWQFELGAVFLQGKLAHAGVA